MGERPWKYMFDEHRETVDLTDQDKERRGRLRDPPCQNHKVSYPGNKMLVHIVHRLCEEETLCRATTFLWSCCQHQRQQ